MMDAPLPGYPTGYPGRETEIAQQMEAEILALCKDESIDIVSHVNTSNSYRDDRSGILFVTGEPLQLRPITDTGIHVQIDEQGATHLNLNEPVWKPEYAITSIALFTEHKLCLACADMFNYFGKWLELEQKPKGPDRVEDAKRPLINAAVHHHNLWSLIVRAQVDLCYICTQILDRMQFLYPAAFEDSRTHDIFRTEMAWFSNTKPDEPAKLFFGFSQPGKRRSMSNYATITWMHLWPFEGYRENFNRSVSWKIRENTSKAGNDTQLSNRTSSAETQALALDWLRRCEINEDGKHDQCNLRTDYLPTRLLDADIASKTGYLFLVVPKDNPEKFQEDKRYATLSHCWGEAGSKNNPLLKSGNFEERQKKGIHVDELPQTFQDAIEVATWCGVRWLWIDCLCIRQDSALDWQTEASMMSNTYRNAYFNISADAGDDSNSGCFVDRDVMEISTLAFNVPPIEKNFFVAPNPYAEFAWTKMAPSFSRAWIDRERQLARRIFHFNSTELVWECCGTDGTNFASEKYPGHAPFDNVFPYQSKLQVGRLHQALKPDEEETYAVWNDTCEALSEKGVTKATDMPIIVAGLAREFAEVLNKDKYAGGLWESTLPASLAWYARVPRSDIDFIAPSWSWLSAGGPVQLVNRARIDSEVELAKVEAIQLSHDFDAPFGPLKKGSIDMTGFLRPIRLELEESGRATLKVYDCDGEALRTIGFSWSDYHGDLFTFHIDSPVSSLEFDCYCFFITIDQVNLRSGSTREVRALLLQRVRDTDSTYQRVGMLCLMDLYALKMRYKFCRPMSPEFGEDNWKALAEKVRSDNDNKASREDAEATSRPTNLQGEDGVGLTGHADDQDQDEGLVEPLERINLGGQSSETIYNGSTVAKNDQHVQQDDIGEGISDMGDILRASESLLHKLYQYDVALDGETFLSRMSEQKVTII